MTTDWKNLGVTGGVGIVAAIAGVYGSNLTADRSEALEKSKYEKQLGQDVGELQGARDSLKENIRNLQAKLEKFSDALDEVQDDVTDTRRSVSDPVKKAELDSMRVKISALETQLKDVAERKSPSIDVAKIAALLARDYAAELRGVSGPAGVRGPQGLKGDVGPTGPAGEKGDVGPQGPTGAQGARGATGPKGATGASGARGAIGAKGEAGKDGATADSNPGISRQEVEAMVKEAIAGSPKTDLRIENTPMIGKANVCFETNLSKPIVGVVFESGAVICYDGAPVLTVRYSQPSYIDYSLFGGVSQTARIGSYFFLNADKSLIWQLTAIDRENGTMIASVFEK